MIVDRFIPDQVVVMSTKASTPSQGPQQAIPLWKYIPLGEYSPPDEPAVEAVRKGIRGALKVFRRASPEAAVPEEELGTLPQQLLDQIVPRPGWRERVKALGAALGPWLDISPAESPLQVVIGAPHCENARVLTELARARRWRIVEHPTPEQILSGGEDWVTQLDQLNSKRLVIPRLERFFLRHYDGMALIRRLFEHLHDAKCHYLIGCHSWAWAYLSITLQVESLPLPPLTLEAVDDQRLSQWLQQLARDAKRRFVFLEQENGRPVLPPPMDPQEGKGHNATPPAGPVEVTGFLKHVAAHSRGNPCIAWAIWRASLQSRAGEEQNAAEDVVGFHGDVIWVKPWSALKFPAPKTKWTHPTLMMLHALLAHGGLPLPSLQRLLPFDAGKTTQIAHLLLAANVVKEERAQWDISRLGYPAVRQILNGEGYLADSF